MSFGIDYGRGQTNIDSNGIRYGVIPQMDILQAWCDEAEPVYPELDEKMEDLYEIEPSHWEVNSNGYQAHTDDYGDIFVMRSPYFTYAQFCSPCAPGACYLRNPCPPNLNNRAYCFGHDWFDEGEAPYPVYSIETGKEVKA